MIPDVEYIKTVLSGISKRFDKLESRSVLPDWNQNSALSADFIRNRTHYKSKKWMTGFEETTAEGVKKNTFNVQIPASNGERCRITWDGEDYGEHLLVVGVGGGGLPGDCFAIGNLSLWSENFSDSGEPFCFLIGRDTDFAAILVASDNTEPHTLKAEFYWEYIVTIPEEYLPAILVRSGDTEVVLTSSTEGSAKQFKITVDDTGTLTAAEITT